MAGAEEIFFIEKETRVLDELIYEAVMSLREHRDL
jgi:hypothetical protein